MKIFRISQNKNNNYDTFDSAVVVAPTEEIARTIHPSGRIGIEWSFFDNWCSRPEDVEVEYIGEAKDNYNIGVILASYNAG